MEYSTEVFKTLYSMLRDFFYHYIAYKEIFNALEDLKGDKEFWCYTCNSHVKMAIICWCMVFGTDVNQTHWKKLSLEESEFRVQLLSACNIDLETWDKYWNSMVDFRNEYVAHRELGEPKKPLHCLDIAYKVAISLEEWVREKIAPDIIDAKTFKELVKGYRRKIRKTLIKISRKKISCGI